MNVGISMAMKINNHLSKSMTSLNVSHNRECALALFETTENHNKYALIYGSNYLSATYNIYDFKKKKWNTNAIKLNNPWFDNDKIMKDGNSKYGFGNGLSMITDLFAKNKTHWRILKSTKIWVF